MSPREKHIPDNALRTSVCLTPEDKMAINFISQVRRSRKDRRTTTNDILVDALWHYIENVEGMSKDQILTMLPPTHHTNVKQMPKPRHK